MVQPVLQSAGAGTFWLHVEVYDRVVVNSRNHMTLAMLTLLVLAAFLLMEVLEWVRSEVMHDASVAFDRRLNRVFAAIFEANLKRTWRHHGAHE